ncbi:SDR family NAD(P)-dependent oxidoreductase [Azospirillum doebereinerae]|uniref:SDR family NAD(P)-dependent oxidoreductase n=1 Tax=Azospirillum doebereinerae TaxID=92933 RepID=UPI001EE5ECBE|nr:SDR family oxidoreductase [Azospirillum doebereinerae]MCG5241284.1 SDR family oxidoreductase [Azospirillum doebereinerae]
MAAQAFLESRFGLGGTVFLVTGGAGGIGYAAARAAAQSGAVAVINDLDPERTEQAAAALRDEGLEATAAPFSVTDPDAVRAGIARILDRHGRIDSLFSNAGNQNRKPFLDYRPDEWASLWQTHVNGAFNLCQAVLPSMVERRSGRIVLMSSISAFGSRGTISAYATAKGGLAAMTRALAVEYGPLGIACNAIAPGYVATGFTTAMQGNDAFQRYIESDVPARRWGTPEDIAGVAVFLAGPASGFINGQVIPVDGGLLATL